MGETFRSLRLREFRYFALGTLVVNVGSWMLRIGQDWLVLEVTGSGTAVGVTTALQFLPMLFVSPQAGKLADRYPKQWLIAGAGVLTGASALALGILVLTGAVHPWHVFALALVTGIGNAVDAPARQAFTRDLVAPADVPNAVGLTSATFHLGRIAGPAAAGLLIHHLGTG
ncbi:MFS transporter, partial [Pseudonocardia pini]|uniref:MFS transporter n=1 Tax=Pseudonocardia pini TaxID=2758030 RepID=UPI0015F10177